MTMVHSSSPAEQLFVTVNMESPPPHIHTHTRTAHDAHTHLRDGTCVLPTVEKQRSSTLSQGNSSKLEHSISLQCAWVRRACWCSNTFTLQLCQDGSLLTVNEAKILRKCNQPTT